MDEQWLACSTFQRCKEERRRNEMGFGGEDAKGDVCPESLKSSRQSTAHWYSTPELHQGSDKIRNWQAGRQAGWADLT